MTTTRLEMRDMKSGLTPAMIADIGAIALEGEPTPMLRIMSTACRLVDGYCRGRGVPAAVRRSYARDVAIWEAAKLVLTPTPAMKSARDWVLEQLSKIGAGEVVFHSSDKGGYGGSWGSRKQVL